MYTYKVKYIFIRNGYYEYFESFPNLNHIFIFDRLLFLDIILKCKNCNISIRYYDYIKYVAFDDRFNTNRTWLYTCEELVIKNILE